MPSLQFILNKRCSKAALMELVVDMRASDMEQETHIL